MLMIAYILNLKTCFLIPTLDSQTLFQNFNHVEVTYKLIVTVLSSC